MVYLHPVVVFHLSWRCSTLGDLIKLNFFYLILAHPSCMDYSVELTARIRADGGSWQCIDCKACVMCQDSGDPVSSKYCYKINDDTGGVLI